MAEITAALVKELRESTGAGMMDCKKALAETGGDLQAAIDWLRAKGLSAAAKKAGRVAAEGLIGVAVEGPKGAMVEVNAETDFVGRNESFQEFVRTVTRIALQRGDDIEALKAAPYPGGKGTVADRLTELVATIGENMALRRVERVAVGHGVVAAYVHSAAAPGIGRIGVLVGIESTANSAPVAELGKQIAMHVAAANPLAVDRNGVSPEVVARERAVLLEQAKESGKPEAIAVKMVEGRLRRFFEESCLVDQAFVIDPERKVGDAVAEVAKAAGQPVAVKSFVRFALGEGIERKESDFAAEVAATLRG